MKAAIVLAGGLEGKFWPRSHSKSPKPYSYITGDSTLLQDTVRRLRKFFFNDEEIYVVTTDSLYEQTCKLLPKLPPENILVEPYQRGTAPCLSLAVHNLRKKMSDDAVITTFPADHIIYNLSEFGNTIDTAMDAAQTMDGIITVGLKPDRPETGYGYIQIDDNHKNILGNFYDKGLRQCVAFAEKPDEGTAERFIQAGDFLWNSGIYAMKISTFLNSIDNYLPGYNESFSKLAQIDNTKEYKEKSTQVYKKLQKLSFDNGVLEKANNVYVIPGSFDWTDLNDWDEYYRITKKDADGNLIQGNVISIDNKNTMVISDDDQIGVIGLEDVVVINHNDGLLVCKRNETHRVEEIINYMKRNRVGKF
jgi:mannose-1-phosphate guanylyltransferase